ncbi:hypothetical protein PRUPE_1G090700 [Prunus persica]|uniref:Uncharacterized protein n=1 Tax=Prunus persica TaxID=3760 RepID=A0A251QUQ5_PRUPE|nr:hypothetical protein PRUPE_1G090700 [Prunus persica]
MATAVEIAPQRVWLCSPCFFFSTLFSAILASIWCAWLCIKKKKKTTPTPKSSNRSPLHKETEPSVLSHLPLLSHPHHTPTHN